MLPPSTPSNPTAHEYRSLPLLLCLPDEYVGKGDRLYVTGRLVHDSYEGEDGQRDTEVESSRGL